jgi:hypothetical protein
VNGEEDGKLIEGKGGGNKVTGSPTSERGRALNRSCPSLMKFSSPHLRQQAQSKFERHWQKDGEYESEDVISYYILPIALAASTI